MLKGFPPRTKAVFLTAAVLLILLAGHLLNTGPTDTDWWVPSSRPAEDGGGRGQVLGGDGAVGGKGLELEEVDAGVSPPLPAFEPAKTEASHSGHEAAVAETPEEEELPCRNLPGADDVVVIMRTGATEIQDKLPVHFSTTFKCYSDLLIFSDYEETFMDRQVHDVLRTVDPKVTGTNNDFELYRRLQNHGRESLHEDELSGKASFEGSKSGKNDNAGWRLDKWKFLPMMVETLRLRPDKKFYIFVESDSYVVWSNLLRWLQKVDASKPIYAGSEVQIGPDIFAHGGSVFMMTNPALKVGAELYQRDQDRWNSWTAGHWAGDCVLGKALHDNGVELTWAWPMFQGGQPEKMDFTEAKGWEKQLWCTPALSYHHFSPVEMKRVWDFEQEWIKSHLNSSASSKGWFWEDYSDVLHHRDVFKNYIWPNLTAETPEWNNLSPDRIPDSEGKTFEECRKLCKANGDCVQFNLSHDGCWISTKDVMLGQPWGNVKSGWMVERIEAWMKRLDKCSGRDGWSVT